MPFSAALSSALAAAFNGQKREAFQLNSNAIQYNTLGFWGITTSTPVNSVTLTMPDWPAYNAIDNVAFGPIMQGLMSRTEAYEKAQSMMADAGLRGIADSYPGEISSGVRRRVEIVRALMNDPLLLLADEPTSAMDMVAERVKKTRDKTFESSRTLGIAHLGGATLDNEECWAYQALLRSIGLVYIEHQARI